MSCVSVQRPFWNWAVPPCSWFHSFGVLFGVLCTQLRLSLRINYRGHSPEPLLFVLPVLSVPWDSSLSSLGPNMGLLSGYSAMHVPRRCPHQGHVEQIQSERGNTRVYFTFSRVQLLIREGVFPPFALGASEGLLLRLPCWPLPGVRLGAGG